MHRRSFLELSAALGGSLWRSQAAPGGIAPPRQPDARRPVLAPADAPLPDWAQTGNFTFMGLDGGPLEAEKGLRSGWKGFSRDDPQGIVQAVRDFYRPENVEIPRTAGVNWVFLTWTNGWSKPRERDEQWPKAARYIEECRKHGIRASAYISAANMFWEDYLERVPASRAWIETRDPGLIRHYGGSLYRVMANIAKPEWRQEIKTSIDAALDAGVDGFWVDNMFWWHGRSLFDDFMREMRAHAAQRGRPLAWHTNVNRGIYNWTRAGNVVGTEDGRVPQWTAGTDPEIKGNLGLLSFISALREGWRSAIVEHYGDNLSPVTRQLMIAECWMHQVAKTWFPVDRLLQAQWHRRDPAAWRVLEAMGAFNRHQLVYREYFQAGEPLATVGIIGHPGGHGDDLETQRGTQEGQDRFLDLIEALGGWNIQYEVLFEERMTAAALRRFAVIVLTTGRHMPEGAIDALDHYTGDGGVLVCPEGVAGSFAQRAVRLPLAAFESKGRPQLLRDAIRAREGTPAVIADAPPSVAYRAYRQARRAVVHLVNYRTAPVEPFTVRYRGRVERVEVLTPEAGGPRVLQPRHDGEWATVRVPEFPVHTLVAFYPAV